MIIRHPLLAAVFAISLLSGCAYRNNYPFSNTFPIIEKAGRLGVYVDANGTFFPDKWREHCPDRCLPYDKNPSLLLKANTEHENAAAFRAHLASDEQRQLVTIERFITNHPRLFVLIHGFNSDEPDAKASYDRVIDRIKLSPDDGIIEFYWDGFVTRPPNAKFSLAPARFWPVATAHSQAAGSRGLRRILALAKDRDIFLISHSRGASVALSALSNPPYSDGFLTKTERLDFDLTDGVDGSPNFLRPPPLPADTGNRIHLLMLAPAIGCIDFSRADVAHRPARIMEAEGCVDVRPLRAEVRFLGYTLNDKDSVLGKFVLPSNWYSATDFGFKPKLGEILGKRWRVMRPFPILAKPHGHDFDCYIADVEFATMLEAAGVGANSNPLLSPRKPCTKADKAQRKP